MRPSKSQTVAMIYQLRAPKSLTVPHRSRTHRSHLIRPTSYVPPHRSHLIRPTSDVPPQTSPLRRPTSYVPPHTSHLGRPTSKIPSQTSRLIGPPHTPHLIGSTTLLEVKEELLEQRHVEAHRRVLFGTSSLPSPRRDRSIRT